MASYALANDFYIKPASGWNGSPLYHFDNSQIVMNSPKGVFSSDIIGNELAIDTFSFTVRYDASERQLYLLTGTPRQLYLLPGYVPGTLESSGWVILKRSNALVAGNAVVLPLNDDMKLVAIQQTEMRNGKRNFHSGDVVRIGIDVTAVTGDLRIFAARNLSSVDAVNVTSETGLFTVWSRYGCDTTETGHDVLTFSFDKWPDPQDNWAEEIIFNTTSWAANESAEFVITGIEFNGQTVYGSLSGESSESERPPMLYLLRPKYDAKQFLADLAFGDPVYWAIENAAFAKGYLSAVERTGRYAWKITCVSGVGLLNDKVHVGGIYTGQTFSAIFADIVGSTFGYSIDAEVGAVPVYGWLSYDSARNNLHRLLFATGAALARHDINSDDQTYDYDVIFPGTTEKTVDDDRVALGGSVQLSVPTDGVEVTEHSFSALATDPVETLYDNATNDAPAADHLVVAFSAPMHDLAVTGTLTINESGVNYAVVTGTGILTGKKYTHSETVVGFGNTAGNSVKRVTSNALVTIANSINVARRVINYYQSAMTVKAKILLSSLTSERCGDLLHLTNAWGEAIKAFLSKMELSITSLRAATVELIEGYKPTNGGNNYTRCQIIKRGDPLAFEIPDDTYNIRIGLIQGGVGGQGGCAGHNGWGGLPPSFGDAEDGQLVVDTFDIFNDAHQVMGYGYTYAYGRDRQQSMPGGGAGAPGGAGKILTMTKAVTPGEVLTFNIGAGGAGGASRAYGAEDGGLGSAGGETTVSSSAGWSATSADGAVSAAGFFETFSNQTFALPGEDGHDGGSGGMSDSRSTDFAVYGASGVRGGSVGNYSGGAGGRGLSRFSGLIGRLTSGGDYGPLNDVGSGGGGGGAAWGRTGNPGGAATYHAASGGTSAYIYTGKGGHGADAVAPAQPLFGCGGGGGNGGGAGGSTGPGTVYHTPDDAGLGLSPGVRVDSGVQPTNDHFGGGRGGSGSAGGQGGDGVAIIYY